MEDVILNSYIKINRMGGKKFLSSLLILAVFFPLSHFTRATQIEVTITNTGPSDGVFFTPVWVGFHNGSFDSYDGGAPAAPELERLAEDGNTAPISSVFGGNGTLEAIPTAQVGTRVQATLGGGPIGSGVSVSETFDLDLASANRYFSYASMVLPSNDYYVANGNPLAHDLSALDGASTGSSISFNIGLPNSVNDAGTEVNFENLGAGTVDESVAGLGLLGPGFIGQSAPDTGTSEGGVNTVVLGDPFTSDLLSSFPNLNFNDAFAYPNGIANVTLTVLPSTSAPVPEPSTLGLSILGIATAFGLGKIRKKKPMV